MSFYCGISRVPRGKRLGTVKECMNSGQVRYWGLESIGKKITNKKKIPKKILDQLKKKDDDDDNLDEENLGKIISRVKAPEIMEKIIEIEKKAKKRLLTKTEWKFIESVAKKISTFDRDIKRIKKLNNKSDMSQLIKQQEKFITNIDRVMGYMISKRPNFLGNTILRDIFNYIFYNKKRKGVLHPIDSIIDVNGFKEKLKKSRDPIEIALMLNEIGFEDDYLILPEEKIESDIKKFLIGKYPYTFSSKKYSS